MNAIVLLIVLCGAAVALICGGIAMHLEGEEFRKETKRMERELLGDDE